VIGGDEILELVVKRFLKDLPSLIFREYP